MSNETVTYSLEAVLTRIEGKIDNLQKDVNQKFDQIDEQLNRGCWINLKTLLGKTFRLLGNQKVPAIGGIGGKIPGLFPWKLANLPDENG